MSDSIAAVVGKHFEAMKEEIWLQWPGVGEAYIDLIDGCQRDLVDSVGAIDHKEVWDDC